MKMSRSPRAICSSPFAAPGSAQVWGLLERVNSLFARAETPVASRRLGPGTGWALEEIVWASLWLSGFAAVLLCVL